MTLALSVYTQRQLTYPIERWPATLRFQNESEVEKLLDTIADSENLRDACRKIGVHHTYVYRRELTDKEFAAKVRAARNASLDLLEENALKIMDNCDLDLVSVSKAKGQLEARLRLIGIARRSQNLTQVNITQNDNRTLVVNDEQRAKLIEARNRALENKSNDRRAESP